MKVVVPAKGNFPPVCILRDVESDKSYIAQTYRRSEKELEVTFVIDSLPPKYEMEALLTDEVPADLSGVENGVTLSESANNQIECTIGGQPFTTFTFAGYSKPFLYPLLAPSGVGVTRSLNENKTEGETTDHVHHRSVWSAYGDVNGHDYWGEGRGHGLQIAKKVTILEYGPVCGTILSQIAWQTQKGAIDLNETRIVTIYGLVPDVRLVDFDIQLTPATGPVKFGDTKEGGILALRVATAMDVPKGGKIQNSVGGIGEAECWGKQADWCDYSGVVEGKSVGAAILHHPDSATFPSYWHVRNYGLMGANPWGLSEFKGKAYNGSFTLEKGKFLSFKYRLLVHAGDANTGNVAKYYLDYAIPPKIATFNL